MKSSKHVETCFVRANNDFDDKLTAFSMEKKFWTKIPKNGHCGSANKRCQISLRSRRFEFSAHLSKQHYLNVLLWGVICQYLLRLSHLQNMAVSRQIMKFGITVTFRFKEVPFSFLKSKIFDLRKIFCSKSKTGIRKNLLCR